MFLFFGMVDVEDSEELGGDGDSAVVLAHTNKEGSMCPSAEGSGAGTEGFGSGEDPHGDPFICLLCELLPLLLHGPGGLGKVVLGVGGEELERVISLE